MLETLEELRPPLKRSLQQAIPMAEITVASVHLDENRALVLTNRALYLIHPSWFRLKVRRWPLEEVDQLKIEPSGDLKIHCRKGNIVQQKVTSRQQGRVKATVEVVNRRLKGLA